MYKVNENWSKEFIVFMNNIGLTSCGYNAENKSIISANGYENDIFKIKPYEYDKYINKKECNFLYKPLNIEIFWYKYPFRIAYSNKKISYEYFKTILKKCLESTK
ncbi:hypothetical protein QEW_4456 [Clostridioides difficile CD160]|nr:hypothetical protein QEW_4456 [Clostridioides difficile CD160]